MIQTCAKCSRVNPADAIYCYYDGLVLGGHNRAGGPVAVGAMPFNSPFVFPDGHSCRSFNELARACNIRWNEARELLQKGLIESFLTGLGRLDLVMAAQEARKFPDPDRALDQLLARLPCDKEALAAPQLQVESQEINLGVIEPGQERHLEIRLDNSGERLLYGEVTVSVPGQQPAWLSLDEKPGVVQRSFQFQEHMVLPVRLQPDRVRASDKPLVATLNIDSSGGSATIQIRAEVPVKPFPEGVLKGAKTGRRIAELAKKQPREAAPLFENGAVADWYKSNGWEYPVPGPAASGLGAIQQFFEALGLAPAPKVTINKKRIEWTGAPGASLEMEFHLQTPEKKYIFAHGTCDQPWLQVERAQLKGNSATLKVRVPKVPDRPGETLKATLTIQSNGAQRFLIPVTLTVSGTSRRPATMPSMNPFDFDAPAPVAAEEEEEAIPVVAIADDEIVAVVQAVEDIPAVAVVEAVADPHEVPEVATVQAVEAVDEVPVIEATEPEPDLRDRERDRDRDRDRERERERERDRERDQERERDRERAKERDRESVAASRAREGVREKPDEELPEYQPRHKKSKAGGGLMGHLLPLLILLVALGGVAAWDFVNPEIRGLASTSDLPTLEMLFDTGTSRFALEVIDPLDPRNADRRKALSPTPRGATRPSGNTGNVCVRFGGKTGEDFIFGKTTRGIATRTQQNPLSAPRKGWITTFYYDVAQMEVIQEVELVKGLSDSLDTCLVKYTITNKSNDKKTVGLRVLLDTYIGTNDGVPFVIPGEPGFITSRFELGEKAIPQYLEAIENPDDPKNPGTAMRLGLRFDNSNIEPPSKVIICGYQDGFSNKRWDVDPQEAIKKDSCVLIYWAESSLNKNEKRVLGYSYGLGEVQGDGRLALSAPAFVAPGSEFVLTTYVHKAEPGQTFRAILPAGFSLAAGESEEKTIKEKADRIPLYWRIKAPAQSGNTPVPIRVEGAGTTSRPVRVVVRDRSIFG
jgi:hypothetical protein